MRLLILLQIIIYLFLPLISYNINFYTELYLATLLFTTGFLVLSFVKILSFRLKEEIKASPRFDDGNSIKSGVFEFFLIIVVLVLYFKLSYDANIIDRRVGTEQIAILFSEIPLHKLIYIRLVDFLFPFVWLYIYVRKVNKSSYYIRILYFFSLIVFILISGKIFSKSELAFLIMSFIVVYGGLSKPSVIFNNISKSIFIFLSIVIIFVTVSYLRFINYDGTLYEMIEQDFISRLNGYKIMASLIEDNVSISLGTYDPNIYKYYITLFPFMEQSVEYKSLALTSAKNYLLYDVLKINQFDETTTYLVDIYYFFGLPGAFLLGCFLGGVARITDQLIRSPGALQDPFYYSIIVVSVQSFSRLEFELIPQCFLFIKLVIFYIPIIYLVSKKK